MNEMLPQTVQELAGLLQDDRDEILAEMETRAAAEEFPTVGSSVGPWLSFLARVVGAERVFEFGSGFGYSAYWFARALPSQGRVVLTERDENTLALAREYFERGGLRDRATFEQGDANQIIEGYDGSFDIVLIDHDKEAYPAALERVRPNLAPGSLVLADNAVTAGPVNPEDVLALVQGESRPQASAASEGVATYLRTVMADEAFETVLLPVGEGLALSRFE